MSLTSGTGTRLAPNVMPRGLASADYRRRAGAFIRRGRREPVLLGHEPLQARILGRAAPFGARRRDPRLASGRRAGPGAHHHPDPRPRRLELRDLRHGGVTGRRNDPVLGIETHRAASRRSRVLLPAATRSRVLAWHYVEAVLYGNPLQTFAPDAARLCLEVGKRRSGLLVLGVLTRAAVRSRLEVRFLASGIHPYRHRPRDGEVHRPLRGTWRLPNRTRASRA